MKKILLALAVLATFQVATAQDKSASAIKAYESALKATENAKKAANPATWIKVGETLMSAYEAPAGNGMIGMDQQNLQMIMAGNKPQSVEEVTIGGQPFTKQVYPAVNYYINADGVLAMIEVTKPAVENALDKAADAYKKAAELDAGGKNEKKIVDVSREFLNSNGAEKHITAAVAAPNNSAFLRLRSNSIHAAASIAAANEAESIPPSRRH